jgi:uncharacterized protein (DUF1778 family)
MKKQEPKKPRPILSFRTNEDIRKIIDKKAKKHKQTRAEFLESLVIAAVGENVQTV